MTRKDPKHRVDLKGKLYEEREAIHAIEFEPSGTFDAISGAQAYLNGLGYTTGSMQRKDPIGFAYEADYVPKWQNIPVKERKQLDGIIIPNPEFREGGAIIIFFNIPKF